MAAADPTPADVRWMNSLASLLWFAVTLVAVAGLLWTLARLPMFSIRGIHVEGEVTHNSEQTIRAAAAPKLVGNFWTMDLDQAKAAFESVPWVREAVVRRVWPDRIAVELREHRAAAYWDPEADGAGRGDDRLVDEDGSVFQANLGDVEEMQLPTLSGPDGAAAAALSLYRRLQPVLQPLLAVPDGKETPDGKAKAGRLLTVRQSERGSWRARLSTGAEIEMGRGSEDELVARTERFVRTVGDAIGHYERPLVYADLRHVDGYAVRLKGVSTTLPPPVAPKRPAKKSTH